MSSNKAGWTKKHYLFAVFVLILISGWFRLSLLKYFPNGLNWDEVAYGYNAYSLMETGKDEWGRPWPIFIKSFGEYKPALLSYILIPFLWMSDDWSWSIRLLPAFLGVIGVLASFGYILQLTKSKTTAFITALLLSITPWHIHYSRAVMDPIIAHTFLVLGLWGWTHSNRLARTLGSLALILSMYTYNSSRVFIPLLVACYLLIFVKDKYKVFFKQNMVPALLLGMGMMWIVAETIWGIGGTRSKIISIFSFKFADEALSQRLTRSAELDLPTVPLIDTKRFYQYTDILKRYSLHFRPDFLFFEGGNLGPGHGFSKHGNLLLLTAPFLLIGMWVSIRKDDTLSRFFLAWLAISPLASALTLDVPHSGRMLVALPAIQYLMAIGIERVIHINKTSPWPKLVSLTIIVGLFLNTLVYWRDYYLFFYEESELIWQGEYPDMVTYAHQVKDQYHRVFITNYYDEPMIFYAWYNKISPELAQQAPRNPFQMSQLANVIVLPKNQPADCLLLQPQTLLITTPQTFAYSLTPKDTFYFDNRYGIQQPSFLAIDTDLLTPAQKQRAQVSCPSDVEKTSFE